MKRSRVLLIVLAIVVAISMLSLTACNKDKHEHTYGEWQITTEPTATEKGSAKRVCECGEEEVVELAVLTDTTVWKLTETQPTHEADGSKVYTSEYGTVTVTVAKIEHAYTAMSWKDGKKPTLTDGATAVWTCKCGAQIEEGVATLSNASVWTKNAERSVAPTHAADGKDVYESAKYGEVEVTIEKIAHTYTFKEWKDSVKPTVEAGATAIMVCSCGNEAEETVAALSDATVWAKETLVPATHTEEGKDVYRNDIYGEIEVITASGVGPHAYTFKEWKDGVKPTVETGATAVMKCECGNETEETVAALSDATVWTKDTVKSVPATHTEDGKDVYVSGNYGEVEVTIEKIAHAYNFIGWKDGVKPTVEAGATAVMVCECTDKTEVNVAALSDTTVWTKETLKAATHTEEGKDVYRNDIYGDIEVVTASGVGAHTYTFKVWKNLEPTLTDGATAIMVCACGNETEETVAALSDTTVWTKSEEKSIEPTHATEGIDVYESAKYPDVEVTVEKIAHTYIFKAWKDGEPTLTESKVAIMRCECGNEVENVVAALSDATVWTKETLVPATHTENGKDVYKNDLYGKIEVVTASGAGAHTYTFKAWKDGVKPTLTDGATATMACACGNETEETVAALSDTTVWTKKTLVPATHAAEGKDVYESAKYAAVEVTTQKIAHTYTFKEWKDSVKPTIETGATAIMKCECGNETEEAVAALSDATVWTKDTVKSVPATHTKDGKDVYVSVKYGEIEVVTASGVGPHTYTFKAWKDGVKPTVETGATATMVCECGNETEETVAALSDATVWTIDAERSVAATYNKAGVSVYVSAVYGDVTLTLDKLVAAYDGKKYSVQLINSSSSGVVSDTAYILEIDVNGKGVDTFKRTEERFYKDANWSFALVDDTKPYGKIIATLTFMEKQTSGEEYGEGEYGYGWEQPEETYEAKTEVYHGYVDVNGNIVLAGSANSERYAASQYILTPCVTALTRENYKISYAWNNNSSAAVAVIVNDVRFNIYSTNENVYMNVSFVDINGLAINAEDIADSKSVKVEFVAVLASDGTRIAAFAKQGDALVATDGKEGVYTNEGATLTVYGNGTFLYVNGEGTFNGEYIANGEGFDAYIIVGGARVGYYYATIDSANKTFTLDEVKVTITFNVGEHGVAIPAAEVSKNIPYDLTKVGATASNANYKFIGWYADEAYAEKLTEITPTGDVTVYALFVDKITVTLVGVKTGDPTEISLAAGDVILTKLPAYTSDTLNDAGTKVFRGWYVGNEEDAIMLTEDIVLSFDEIIETIWAKWVDTAKLTIDYAGKKNNDVIVYGVGDTIDLTEYKVNVGAYDIFEDFYTEAECVNKFTATVINADITVYAKFNVSATPFYGTSKGVYINYSYSTSSGVISSVNAKAIDVDIEGNVSGQISGTVVFTNTEKTAFTVGDNDGFFDAETGLLFFGRKGKVSNIFCYGADDFTIQKDGSNVQGSHCSATQVVIMNLVITKNGVDTIVPVYLYHGEAFINVHFADEKDAEVTNMRLLNSIPKELKVYDVNNTLVDHIYKKGYNDLVRKDGFEGTYTGDKGVVVMDGLGTLTIDGGSALAYTVNDKGNGIVEYTSSTENVILTLNVAEKTYTSVVPTVTITFEMEGHGEAIAPITANKKVAYTTSLPTPTAEGYSFEGWYLVKTVDEETGKVSYSSKVSTISATTMENDVTLYATWAKVYTVTYVTAHGDAPEAVTAKENSWIYSSSLPTMPETVDGLYFDGWQKEDGTKITGSLHVTSDMTITAIWLAPVTLTAVYGNGIADKAISVKPGATIDSTQYAVDATNGKIAMGYYTDSALTTEFTATSITVDTTIYAKWVEAGTYTITLGNTYGFAYDGSDNSWKNANKGVKSSTASLTITAVDGPIDVRFSYWYSSENSDKTTIKCAGKQVVSSGGIMTAAEAVNIVTVLNVGETIEISYSKDSSVDKGDDTLYIVNLKINSMAVTRPESPDFMGGTYTCEGEADLVLDGFGGYTRGEQTGTYEKVTGESYNAIVYIDGAAYKLTITGNVYALEAYTVTVSYNFGNIEATLASEQKYYGENFTLPAAPAVEGYVFRAWYTDADLTKEAGNSVVLTGDITFYAKYVESVTATFDYNGQGTEAQVVVKARGDKLLASEIPAVGIEVTFGTKTFIGWYTANGTDDNWGDAVTANTVVSENVTYYAKWADAPKSYGTYKGWNYYGASTSGSKANSDLSTAILVVDATGKYGLKSETVSSGNSLTEAQAKVEEGALILNNVYHYFSRDLGLVWRAYRDMADSVGSDTYLGFDISRVAKVDYVGWNNVAFNGVTTYTGFITITYNDNTTRNAFLYNNVVVKDVKWNSGVTTVAGLKDLTTSGIDVFNSSDVQIFQIVNKEILVSDGKGGAYTGEYGEITLNGFGTATIGETSFEYTFSGNEVSFVLNNASRKITLSEGTYEKALDGYEGTYTLPDGNTLTLDGYGNAGEGKTYVTNGNSITIFEGEVSNGYTVDTETKQFLTKGQFAGCTFSGSYYDAWDEGTDKITIVFDESASLAGTFNHLGGGYSNALSVKFTAVFEGSTLTLTFTEYTQGSSNNNIIGKTMTLELTEDNKLKVTKFPISSGSSSQYGVKTGTVLTSTDFAG